MDATDWSGPFKSLEAAKQDCHDTFDIDPDTGDDIDDSESDETATV